MIRKIFALLGVSFFALTGCGTQIDDNIGTVSQSQNVSTFSDNSVNSSKTDLFISDVAKIGVKLNSDQLKIISTQRHLKTSGNFASRPAENLSAEKNLTVHFNKHKKEFPNVKTVEDYLQAAIDFHNRKGSTINYYFDTTSFSKGYQSNVVKYDSKTHELSALRGDGDITTYYTGGNLSPKRFVLVPEEFKI